MQDIDPRSIFEGADLICGVDGEWPNFHDADIIDLHLWRGDMRPENNVFVGPEITIKLMLCALDHPIVVELKFQDCNSIKMPGFNHDNSIMDLQLGIEERGTFTDGTSLPPYILVHFLPTWEFELSFKCFRASVISVDGANETNDDDKA